LLYRPLYWLSIALSAGMLCAYFWLAGYGGALISVLTCFIILAWRFVRFEQRYVQRLIFIVFLLGLVDYGIFDKTNQTTIPPVNGDIPLEGVIASNVNVNGDLLRFDMKLTAIKGHAYDEKVNCSIILHSREEQRKAENLSAGTYVYMAGTLSMPDSARNPGGFDYRKYLFFQRIHWIVQSNSFAAAHFIPPRTFSPAVLLHSLQAYLSQSLDKTFPNDSEWLKALLLGDRGGITGEMAASYTKLGIIHVLAISGLHMTIIVEGMRRILRLLGITRESVLLLTILFIPFYVVITGASPSVVRSGMMAVISLLGLYLHRPRDGLNMLGAALFIMLLVNPYQLWDVGFQLSFLVTWGILLFVPQFELIFPKIPSFVATFLFLPLVAQIISFPILIYVFHQFSFLSFFVNILFVPLFTFWFIPFGFLAFLLGLISPGLAYLLAGLLSESLQLMNHLLSAIASWKGGQIYLEAPPDWWFALYYMLLFSKWWWPKALHPRWLLLIALFLSLPFVNSFFRTEAQITFLDVGQGDAIVVQLPNHKVYLIDGGGKPFSTGRIELWKKERNTWDAGKRFILPFLKSQGINQIDTLVMTHGDIDHIGGLASVIADMKIGRIIGNGKPPTSREEEALLGQIKAKRIPIFWGKRGITWQEGIARWTLLNPGPNRLPGDNNSSIVLLLEVFKFHFLFTGDLEKEGERDLLAHEQLPRIDVLKVGHHGSRSSTSIDFLEQIQPVVSILSVGRKNRFGHPHKETIEALEKFKSEIFRTDEQGAIQIEIFQDNMIVKHYLHLTSPTFRLNR
jgi:competence protein ComEC